VTRDLTERQFEKFMRQAGFVREILGYWKLPPPNDHTSMAAPMPWDGVKVRMMFRRDRLAWFLRHARGER